MSRELWNKFTQTEDYKALTPAERDQANALFIARMTKGMSNIERADYLQENFPDKLIGKEPSLPIKRLPEHLVEAAKALLPESVAGPPKEGLPYAKETRKWMRKGLVEGATMAAGGLAGAAAEGALTSVGAELTPWITRGVIPAMSAGGYVTTKGVIKGETPSEIAKEIPQTAVMFAGFEVLGPPIGRRVAKIAKKLTGKIPYVSRWLKRTAGTDNLDEAFKNVMMDRMDRLKIEYKNYMHKGRAVVEFPKDVKPYNLLNPEEKRVYRTVVRNLLDNGTDSETAVKLATVRAMQKTPEVQILLGDKKSKAAYDALVSEFRKAYSNLDDRTIKTAALEVLRNPGEGSLAKATKTLSTISDTLSGEVYSSLDAQGRQRAQDLMRIVRMKLLPKYTPSEVNSPKVWSIVGQAARYERMSANNVVRMVDYALRKNKEFEQIKPMLSRYAENAYNAEMNRLAEFGKATTQAKQQAVKEVTQKTQQEMDFTAIFGGLHPRFGAYQGSIHGEDMPEWALDKSIGSSPRMIEYDPKTEQKPTGVGEALKGKTSKAKTSKAKTATKKVKKLLIPIDSLKQYIKEIPSRLKIPPEAVRPEPSKEAEEYAKMYSKEITQELKNLTPAGRGVFVKILKDERKRLGKDQARAHALSVAQQYERDVFHDLTDKALQSQPGYTIEVGDILGNRPVFGTRELTKETLSSVSEDLAPKDVNGPSIFNWTLPLRKAFKTPTARLTYKYVNSQAKKFDLIGHGFKQRYKEILKDAKINSGEDYDNFVFALQNLSKIDQGLYADLEPRIVDAARRMREVEDDVFKLVKKYDPTVRYLEDHFVHFPTRRELLRIQEELEKHAIELNTLKSLETALGKTGSETEKRLRKAIRLLEKERKRLGLRDQSLLNSRFKRLSNGKYAGPFNEARRLGDVLEYHKNPYRVYEEYISTAIRKAYIDSISPLIKKVVGDLEANSRVLSKKGKVAALNEATYLYNMMRAIQGTIGIDQVRLWEGLIREFSDKLHIPEPVTEVIVRDTGSFLMRLNFLTKIAMSWVRFPIQNLSQPVLTTYPMYGASSSIKGLLYTLASSKAVPKRFRLMYNDLARSAGVTLETYSALGEFREMLTKIEKALSLPASLSEDFNRLHAFNTSLIDSMKRGFDIHKLEDRNEMLRRAIAAVDYGQGSYGKQYAPLVASVPGGRQMFQFKQFWANYVSFLHDLYKVDKIRFTKALMSAFAVGGTYGIGLEYFRDLVLDKFGIYLPEINPLEWATEAIGISPGWNIGHSLDVLNPLGFFGISDASYLLGAFQPIYKGMEAVFNWEPGRYGEKKRRRIVESYAPYATRIYKYLFDKYPLSASGKPITLKGRTLSYALGLQPSVESVKYDVQKLLRMGVLKRNPRAMQAALDKAKKYGIPISVSDVFGSARSEQKAKMLELLKR